MADQTSHRRLAAIMVADVVGYSRMMGADEAATLAAVKSLRAELIDPKIAEHSGRIFKTTGDGFLAEFPSVVNAVNCAVAIQRQMTQNLANRGLQLRMGINVGDVVVEDGDVFGDGVNVAARIESLAPSGGIALTETAREHLGSKLKLDFRDIGAHSLKNIEKPIRVFVVCDIGDGGIESASGQPHLVRPSIAVLPFQNMSGDPDQEYFSDGLTEDLITELSRFRALSVIARHSSFHYKGRSPKIQEVARELGVQWVVEGSVRKSGTRVRITSQLIDASTGSHIWAEKYDRVLEDIFQVQDDVVRAVAATVGGRLDVAGRERSLRLKPSELRAYDLFLRSKAHFFKFTREAIKEAITHCERAVEIDPRNVMALSYLALERCLYGMMWFSNEPQVELDRSLLLAKQAVELDDANASAHFILGFIQTYKRNFTEARVHNEKALALNPNDSEVRGHYANYLVCVGEPERAIEQLEISRLHNPFDVSWFPWIRGIVFFTARNYEAAIEAFKQLNEPNHEALLFLAASYAQADQATPAIKTMTEFLTQAKSQMPSFPGADPHGWRKYLHTMMPYEREADETHLIDAVRRAGLPV